MKPEIRNLSCAYLVLEPNPNRGRDLWPPLSLGFPEAPGPKSPPPGGIGPPLPPTLLVTDAVVRVDDEPPAILSTGRHPSNQVTQSNQECIAWLQCMVQHEIRAALRILVLPRHFGSPLFFCTSYGKNYS